MALMNKQPYGYSKIENADEEEEVKHRRAQFLIYKAMQKADNGRRRPSWLRVKMFKLKIKIGKRFKNFKKGFSSTSTILFSNKPHFYKQISSMLKSRKHLLHGTKQQPTLRPIF